MFDAAAGQVDTYRDAQRPCVSELWQGEVGREAAAYQHLRQAGKPPKLAFIALARKLLVTANAVLRDQRAFQP